MDFLQQLWLPILLSGAGVWIASFLAWMVIGHHKRDRSALPNEREFMETVARMNIAPGNYGFPDFCQHDGLPREERMKAMKALFDRRPMGLLRVWAEPNMGMNMLLTFVFYLAASAVIGYLGWLVLPHGPGSAISGAVGAAAGTELFWRVFQVTGIAGLLAYCFASFPNDIWFQTSRRAMLMNWIDGVVFACITGLIFAWRWPG